MIRWAMMIITSHKLLDKMFVRWKQMMQNLVKYRLNVLQRIGFYWQYKVKENIIRLIAFLLKQFIFFFLNVDKLKTVTNVPSMCYDNIDLWLIEYVLKFRESIKQTKICIPVTNKNNLFCYKYLNVNLINYWCYFKRV